MTTPPDDMIVELVLPGDVVADVESGGPDVAIEVAVDHDLDPTAVLVVVDLDPGVEVALGVEPMAIDVFERFANSVGEQNPVFTYSSGLLSRIDYASGNYKTFTYSSGVLTRLDYVTPGSTTRKTFTYSGGVLISVTETVLP